MLSSVEQAFVGREEIRASVKTPAWEAIKREHVFTVLTFCYVCFALAILSACRVI